MQNHNLTHWPPDAEPEVSLHEHQNSPATNLHREGPLLVAQVLSLPRPDSSGRLRDHDAPILPTPPPILHPLHPSYASDTLLWARHHLHFQPDPIQSQILAAPSPYILLNCSRQWGKTTVIAIKTLHFALFHPRTTTLVAAPSERQSTILLRRLQAFLKTLSITPAPVPGVPFSIRLPNASEITALPASADTIRGFTAHLLIFDEAARVPGHLYHALSPTRATTAGPLWLLSTPNGPDGFFYDAWHADDFAPPSHRELPNAAASASERDLDMDTGSGGRERSERVSGEDHSLYNRERREPGPAGQDPPAPHWTRFRVPATDCPRITPDFLDHERLMLGDDMFRQEYLCEFITPGGFLLSRELIESAIDPSIEPLFPGPIFSNLTYNKT
jgi:hypothetical protein